MIKELERAGMVDQATGFIGRPIPTGRILVPGSITMKADGLHWKVTEKSRFVTPERPMLNGFIQLSNNPLGIVSFAERWGVLAVDHHNRLCAEAAMGGRDSIEAWRFFSRRALAVLNLIASIKQGKIGGIDDWKQLCARDDSPKEFTEDAKIIGEFRLPVFMGFPQTIRQAGAIIESELNSWMAVWRQQRVNAASDFRVDNTGSSSWQMQVDFHGFLFSALAFQLCLIAVNADSLYCCSGCGYPYVRARTKRRPRPGQANYCDECLRLGIPVRRASERYRERKTDVQTKTR